MRRCGLLENLDNIVNKYRILCFKFAAEPSAELDFTHLTKSRLGEDGVLYFTSTPPSEPTSFNIGERATTTSKNKLPTCLPKPPRASTSRPYVAFPKLTSFHYQTPPRPHNPSQNVHLPEAGHRKQDLAPVPNPWHTAHHPRRKDCHSSRSRDSRRSLPTALLCRLNRPQQPPTTIERA